MGGWSCMVEGGVWGAVEVGVVWWVLALPSVP